MKMRALSGWETWLKIFGLTVLGCMFLRGSLAVADTIYIESGGTKLFKIDSTNGTSTLVGSYGVTGVLAQAFSPNGTLYAIFKAGSTSAQLATVNTNTGVATPIGAPAGVPLEAMAFTPDGTLYAGNFNTNSLYTVNPTTGSATLVGNLGLGNLGFAGIMDMAWDPANSTMYAIASGCNGSALYSIDLQTGHGTLDATIASDNCLMALAIDSSNRLLATSFNPNSPLYQIDPSTGNLANLGSTGLASTMGAAAAPTPEPVTALTLGSSLLLVWLRKARRR